MGIYLMMMYVSVEQELAVKDLFTDKGWDFKKPDLRMTTDEVGPLIEETVQSERTFSVVDQQEQPIEDSPRPRRGMRNKQGRSSPVSKPPKRAPRVIRIAKKDNASDHSPEYQEILEDSEVIAASLNQTSNEIHNAGPDIKINVELLEYDQEMDDDEFNSEQNKSQLRVSELNDSYTSSDMSTSDTTPAPKERKPSVEMSETAEAAANTNTETPGLPLVSPSGEIEKNDDDHITSYQTRFQCDLCKKIYATKYSAMRHLKSHEAGLARCNDCHVYYERREALEEHRKLRHPSPVPCPFCSATFTRKSGLNFHMTKVHDKSYQGKYHCSYKTCTRTFQREKALTEHMNKHLGIKPHMCEKCGKVFALSDSMFRHKKVCVENIKYKCADCGKEYASSGSLSSHKSSAHLKKVYACSCGRIFKHNSGLIKHRKMTGHTAQTADDKSAL